MIYDLAAFEGLVEMRRVKQRFEPSDPPRKQHGHKRTAAAKRFGLAKDMLARWFLSPRIQRVGSHALPPPLEGFGRRGGVAAQGDRNTRKDGLRLRLVVVMMQKLEIRDKMR